jgi:hypothetical protein
LDFGVHKTPKSFVLWLTHASKALPHQAMNEASRRARESAWEASFILRESNRLAWAFMRPALDGESILPAARFFHQFSK